MALTALRGAIAFLTRLPIDASPEAWEAFQRAPWTFPLVGFVIGGLVAIPFVVPAPSPTVATLYVFAVILVTGVTHVDGLADVGDAAAANGTSPDRRREIMTEPDVGAGGVLAVAFGVGGLALAGLALAELPAQTAVALVVVAEVGAKLGMAVIACVGRASHRGMGAGLTRAARPRSFAGPLLVATPFVAVTWPTPAAALALVAAVTTSLLVLAWARAVLNGVSGDVFGAANELSRIAALHVGVIVWTLW
ncbi:adenosylcobinamide-GDP ribazoletransferase [Halovivax sp.]|uniref:adenosylcobinamide-GDP ribazoletransferase n=1 Tax=Halovivax sp. TaxID=1935978 RepID=UPI0025C0B836|nr:adenosylcobinamide-GDP ribazoletransferase [Halovivax sp.]